MCLEYVLEVLLAVFHEHGLTSVSIYSGYSSRFRSTALYVRELAGKTERLPGDASQVCGTADSETEANKESHQCQE